MDRSTGGRVGVTGARKQKSHRHPDASSSSARPGNRRKNPSAANLNPLLSRIQLPRVRVDLDHADAPQQRTVHCDNGGTKTKRCNTWPHVANAKRPQPQGRCADVRAGVVARPTAVCLRRDDETLAVSGAGRARLTLAAYVLRTAVRHGVATGSQLCEGKRGGAAPARCCRARPHGGSH